MLPTNDIINGCFETIGGLLCWFNVHKLLKDRRIHGVYWPVQAFFASWGWWNVFLYYPSLDQWASFVGALILVIGNTAWVLLALKFRKANGDAPVVKLPPVDLPDRMMCPVCGAPAKLKFAKGKGQPYIACDQHGVESVMLALHGDPRRVA